MVADREAETQESGSVRIETQRLGAEGGFDASDSTTIRLMAGTFFHGDNLDVLRVWIPDDTVDLVYLDPPFNSDEDYNLPFGSDPTRPTQKKLGFTDRWRWDDNAIEAYEELTKTRVELLPEKLPPLIRALYEVLYPKYQHVMLAYVVNMAIRLVELRRVMKPTGSLYLHCDPTASHYLKLVLDTIFGVENFVNEIIWQRTNARSVVAGCWPTLHDTLLYYRRSKATKLEKLVVPADKNKLPHTLVTGPDGLKYQSYELTAPEIRHGETGEPWRGFNVTAMGRHWGNLHAMMDELDSRGLIHWPAKGGFPRRRDEKPFSADDRRVVVGDVWTDIDRLNQTAKERTGYPTQKPLALLRRVIQASSSAGDLVLDPFCGCGTAIIACEQLGRKWLGIDIGEAAIGVLRDKRIPREAKGATFNEEIEPFDVDSARLLVKKGRDPRYDFQWWAVRKLEGQPIGGEKKKGADRGRDGEIFIEAYDDGHRRRRVLISVKSGKKPAVKWVTDLADAVANKVHQAYMGILVTLEEPHAGMRARAREYERVPATRAGDADPYKIQIVTVADLFKKGHGIQLPGLNVTAPTVAKLQMDLQLDQSQRRDPSRTVALVSDNTGRAAERVLSAGPAKTPTPPPPAGESSGRIAARRGGGRKK